MTTESLSAKTSRCMSHGENKRDINIKYRLTGNIRYGNNNIHNETWYFKNTAIKKKGITVEMLQFNSTDLQLY